jgi:ABC-type molybdenum transport system, ATPase component/photorepair protein PhrA
MRLALFARAMIDDPELLLLDEPCTGLDPDTREHVLDVLQRLATSGTQIVMAVHDPEDIVPAVRHVLRIGRRGSVSLGYGLRATGDGRRARVRGGAAQRTRRKLRRSVAA